MGGSHYRISALSGGQKVKVALGGAIQEFDGGVVIISHNNDFCQMLCPETWVVEKDADGISRPNCKGDPEWMKHAMETKVNDQQTIDEVTDAAGNVTKLKKKKDVKKLNKKELKKFMQVVKDKIAAGDDLDTGSAPDGATRVDFERRSKGRAVLYILFIPIKDHEHRLWLGQACAVVGSHPSPSATRAFRASSI